MNAAHWHLVLNHIPVLATLFSIPILIWGMVANQPAIKKVALAGFIISALAVVAVVQSGEAAEDIAESVPGVIESTIHDHEEAAEITQWLTIILGAVSLFGFFMIGKMNKYSKQLIRILLVYSLVVGGMLVYTANLGGKIMHPELSNTFLPSQNGQTENEDH